MTKRARYRVVLEYITRETVPETEYIPEEKIKADKRVLSAFSGPVTGVNSDTYKGNRLATSDWGLIYEHVETDEEAAALFRANGVTDRQNVRIGEHWYMVKIEVEAAGLSFAERRANSILARLVQDYPVAGKLEFFGGGAYDDPDWASLYSAKSPATEDDDLSPLTPRTAAVLHTALELLRDQAWDWDAFSQRLPRLARSQNRDWGTRFVTVFFDLAHRLAAGEGLIPRCTAEEMALHLAIADAPELLADTITDGDVLNLNDLPACDGQQCSCSDASEFGCESSGHFVRNDYDWSACSDMLFEDHDVLMLFDPELDGIDRPDSTINQELGLVNLNPGDWFKPFD